MVFTKVSKNASYFSRYQVPLRRRREGKTDYKARRAMIIQDRRLYNTPKYRMVVRITNTRVICQMVYATLVGDRVICSADSNELPRYGMPVGLTNYAASYATGLLLARRLLPSVNLAFVEGHAKVDGEMFDIEQEVNGDKDEEQRVELFTCILDVGLVRTCTGNRVFGAMKGAVDGGLLIPHSEKRFPGFTAAEGKTEENYDAETHRKRIFGLHVADYMKSMKEEDEEKFNSHFSQYVKNGITADNMEEKYAAVHAAIRKNPAREEKSKSKDFPSKPRAGHITRKQRREKAMGKLKAVAEKMNMEAE